MNFLLLHTNSYSKFIATFCIFNGKTGEKWGVFSISFIHLVNSLYIIDSQESAQVQPSTALARMNVRGIVREVCTVIVDRNFTRKILQLSTKGIIA